MFHQFRIHPSWWGITTGAVMAATLAGCGTPGHRAVIEHGGTQAAPILRVGMTPNMPPVVYKQSDSIIGLEPDLARALAKELGRQVCFVELKWEDQIPALQRKSIDIIMSGMSITKMKALRIAFTEPYLQVGQLALVRRKDLNRFFTRGAVMLCSGRVGVEKGTTGDLLVQQEFPHAQKIDYKSPNEAVKDLIHAKIDLMIHDAPVIWWLAAEKESEGVAAVNIPLTTEYLAWGIREDDQELLNAVNRVLEQWKQEEKLQSIIHRWIPYANEM